MPKNVKMMDEQKQKEVKIASISRIDDSSLLSFVSFLSSRYFFNCQLERLSDWLTVLMEQA